MAGRLSTILDLVRLSRKIQSKDKSGKARWILKRGLQLLPGGKLSKLGMMWTVLKLAYKAMAWYKTRNSEPLVAPRVRTPRRQRAVRQTRTAEQIAQAQL